MCFHLTTGFYLWFDLEIRKKQKGRKKPLQKSGQTKHSRKRHRMLQGMQRTREKKPDQSSTRSLWIGLKNKIQNFMISWRARTNLCWILNHRVPTQMQVQVILLHRKMRVCRRKSLLAVAWRKWRMWALAGIPTYSIGQRWQNTIDDHSQIDLVKLASTACMHCISRYTTYNHQPSYSVSAVATTCDVCKATFRSVEVSLTTSHSDIICGLQATDVWWVISQLSRQSITSLYVKIFLSCM